VVHYVSHGTPVRTDGTQAFDSRCRAAVITQVVGNAVDPVTFEAVPDLWVVGLCVLNPTGMFFHESVVQMEHAHDGGTWHWPERV
jgi:hypothetical protein